MDGEIEDKEVDEIIEDRIDKQEDNHKNDDDNEEDEEEGEDDYKPPTKDKEDDDDDDEKEDDEEKESNDDSEDDNDKDEEIITKRSNHKIIDDDDEDEENEDEDNLDKEISKKKKEKQKIINDDDEDEEDDDDSDSDSKPGSGSDSDNSRPKVKEKEASKKKKSSDKEDDEDDEEEEEEEDDNDEVDEEEVEREPPKNTTLYDFDIMMAKKKEESSRKRKRGNYDVINDNDDIIAEIINQMRDAVEADSEANKNKQAATKKLKLLPFVISQLRKVDLRDAFLDSDILSLITEWLAPLPDKSLPHLSIRENLLKILIEFNLYDVDRIKGSGIGKAIMYLYKHPKETKENKQRAKQLISCWSRPIFQLDSSFNAISREEREQRDLELMSRKRTTAKQSGASDPEAGSSSNQKKNEAKKPGDKGWIPRARVPAPSMKDYVIRPRSKVDGDVGKTSKRPSNMLEKYIKNQQELKRANKRQRAVDMKIDRV